MWFRAACGVAGSLLLVGCSDDGGESGETDTGASTGSLASGSGPSGSGSGGDSSAAGNGGGDSTGTSPNSASSGDTTSGSGGDTSGTGGSGTGGGLPLGCGTSPELPEPILGSAYYISDCAEGADAGCVAGDDANPGTSADAPRRSLSGIDLDNLPAGTQILFARGGAWADVRILIRNGNATPESPIVLGAYDPSWGGTARPWLRSSSVGGAIEFGAWNESSTHGGYLVEGLLLDGAAAAEPAAWGIWVREGTEHLSILDTEITNFQIGVHVQGTEPLPVRYLTLRDNDVHHNTNMGMLAHADDFVVEGNRFSFNNFTGSAFSHGVYLGGINGGSRVAFRNNLLERNSVVDGACAGGNFTMHGQWEDVLIEGNRIIQDRSVGTCYGFSLLTSYEHPEWFRGFVVRGNVVVNLGYNSINANAAPGIIIENNLIVNDQDQYGASISVGHPELAPGDDADHDAIIRNNTIVRPTASAGTHGIHLRFAGPGVVVTSNLVSFGAGASGAFCFEHEGVGDFATFANNLCHGGSWSTTYATLAAAQAAGLDTDGVDGEPAFEALPSADNDWSALLSASSPAIDAGHPLLSSSLDHRCGARTTPDIGAFER
jgi:hypothetical protein